VMKKYGVLVAVVLATHCFAGSAHALAINNASFENGLVGWDVSSSTGAVSVASTAVANSGVVYAPTAGKSMAMLNGTSFMSQKSSWNTGDTISFDWAFLARDYAPFNDYSIFAVTDSEGYVYDSVKLASVKNVGDYGDTGWQTYTYVFDNAFDGVLQFGSINSQDQALSSTLLVDNVKPPAQTPIPGAAWLFGSSLLGLLGIGNRKSKA